MKDKLIRNSVLTASTILFIGCLVKLLPNRSFQLFLIAGTLGSTGIVLVKKERELQNVYKTVNNKILVLENQIEKITENPDVNKQEFLDLIDLQTQIKLQKVDEKIASLEQLIKDTVKISNSELQTLITKQNSRNQSTIVELNANLADLREKIVQLQDDSEPSEPVYLGIIELLKCKKVEIEPTPIEHDLQPNNLANHIAKNYDSLQDFCWRLIQSTKNNHAFEYCLRNKHIDDIRIHTVFGSELKKLGFPEYRYDRNLKIMYIPACQDQAKTKIIQFLTGSWFEVYTLNMIIKYLKNNSQLKYEFLLNPYANFFKENDNRVCRKHELDLLLLIEGHLIWIECKSGNVQDDELQKYSDNNRQFLKLPKQNVLVVCFKFSETRATNTTQQYPGITVINPNSLLQSIETILNSEPISSPVLKSTTKIVEVQNKSLKKIDNQPVRVSS